MKEELEDMGRAINILENAINNRVEEQSKEIERLSNALRVEKDLNRVARNCLKYNDLNEEIAVDLRTRNNKLEEENTRLNNIINELEKALNDELYEIDFFTQDKYVEAVRNTCNKYLDKLKELKENK